VKFALIKEWLKYNNLVALFNKAHECRQHAYQSGKSSSLCSSLSYNPPSFAPVVIVTSVSGLSCRPKKGEYASAMAFFNRGLPYLLSNPCSSLFSAEGLALVGEY
jgi:hypothetical protein